MQLDRKKNGAGIVVHIKREGRSRGIPAFKASGGRKGEKRREEGETRREKGRRERREGKREFDETGSDKDS